MRVYVPDHPGALQGITVIAASKRANIVEILHDRAYFGVHLGDTVIDITLETRGPEHVAEIVKSLDDAGYSYQRVQ